MRKTFNLNPILILFWFKKSQMKGYVCASSESDSQLSLDQLVPPPQHHYDPFSSFFFLCIAQGTVGGIAIFFSSSGFLWCWFMGNLSLLPRVLLVEARLVLWVALAHEACVHIPGRVSGSTVPSRFRSTAQVCAPPASPMPGTVLTGPPFGLGLLFRYCYCCSCRGVPRGPFATWAEGLPHRGA